MDGSSIRTTAAGFLAALVVLAVLLWVVGVDAIVATISRADPSVVVFLPAAAAVWLTAWGLSLRVVLGVLGTPTRMTRSVLVYAAATFANNVTPFGQAGGEPVSAFLIASVTDNEYEFGLAAIASVDALNFIPSIGLASVGLAYFAATAALGRQLVVAAAAVSGFVVALSVGAYLLWRYRIQVEAAITRIVTPVLGAVARIVPGRERPTREAVLARVESFFHALERVAADRRQLSLALVFSTIGWVALSSSLWLALLSLGHAVPVAAVLLILPIGSMAGVTPFPGGLGGIEAVLVALLVPTTSIDPATAGAAVVLHRAATYWLPTLVGGGIAAALGVDTW
jgi:uncharacterized protein (TIRG00374 family)